MIIKAVILSPWLRRTQPWLKSLSNRKVVEMEGEIRVLFSPFAGCGCSRDLPPNSQGAFGIAEGWVLLLHPEGTHPLQDSFYCDAE